MRVRALHSGGIAHEDPQFPDGRRKELLSEYDSLRAAAATARRKRFESDEFTNQFSTDEQQVLKDLTGLFPARTPRPPAGSSPR